MRYLIALTDGNGYPKVDEEALIFFSYVTADLYAKQLNEKVAEMLNSRVDDLETWYIAVPIKTA